MLSDASPLFVRLLAVLLIIPFCPAFAQDIDQWELGIEYPSEDSDKPFEVSRDGRVSIDFFVENSGLIEITLEFEYDVPFGGKIEAPEGETVAGGANESFKLVVSGIDVYSFDAEKKEGFSITATVTARQGVPDPLNSQQTKGGDFVIPTIYDLSVQISEPFGPINSGTETILRVTVKNDGNVQDKVGEVDVSDDCPLLTTDNGLDSLMLGSIERGKSKQADFTISASESHPRRGCDVSVTVSSNGAMNSGESVVVSEDVRISVEPPPVAQEETSEIDDSGPSESVKSNLPASGFISTIISIIAASSIISTKRKNLVEK